MAQGSEQRRINKGDWTLGIFQTYWGAASDRSTAKRNGAATLTNTYRCVAEPDGSLGPLPTISESQTITKNSDLPWSGGGALQGILQINDIVCLGVSNVNGIEAGFGHSTIDYQVFVSYSWRYTVTAGIDANWVMVRAWNQLAGAALPIHDIFVQKYAASLQQGPQATLARVVIAFSTAIPPAPALPGANDGEMAGRILISQMARTTNIINLTVFGTLTAADQVAFANYYAQSRQQYSMTNAANTAVANSSIAAWPGPVLIAPGIASAPRPYEASGAIGNNPQYTALELMLLHQGRIIGIYPLGHRMYQGAAAAEVVSGTIPDNGITFNRYADFFFIDTTNPDRYYLNDDLTGYGALGSINASQLLLVKHQGGGLLINGSVIDPTVVELPFVESTGGLVSAGVNTPIGFVYGSRNGVFAWPGGEQSEKLSTQLEGAFWYDSALWFNRYGHKGRFAYWHPFVAVPRNYLFDIRTHSWWKLDIPDPTGTPRRPEYFHYDVSPVDHSLIAAPGELDISNSPASAYLTWARYPLNTFASSYSWQSQPLLETELILTEFTELILVAQRQNTSGVATVTITLSGYREDGTAVTPVVTTFTLPSNTLINTFRYAMGVGSSGGTFVAKSVQYRIEVSNTLSAAAAIIHDLDFMTVAQSGELPLVTS